MTFAMTWVLVVDKAVKKTLQRIPRKDADQLSRVVQDLTINPYAGDINV